MIKTRVIQTRLMPESKYIAITLFGIVFTRKRSYINKYVLNHELIHCQQQLEWLYLPFFVLYFFEWLWYLIKYRSWDRAYRSISFEREAYAHQNDLNYLRRRKHYQNYRKE